MPALRVRRGVLRGRCLRGTEHRQLAQGSGFHGLGRSRYSRGPNRRVAKPAAQIRAVVDPRYHKYISLAQLQATLSLVGSAGVRACCVRNIPCSIAALQQNLKLRNCSAHNATWRHVSPARMHTAYSGATDQPTQRRACVRACVCSRRSSRTCTTARSTCRRTWTSRCTTASAS